VDWEIVIGGANADSYRVGLKFVVEVAVVVSILMGKRNSTTKATTLTRERAFLR
jgi:hypothetical protein